MKTEPLRCLTIVWLLGASACSFPPPRVGAIQAGLELLGDYNIPTGSRLDDIGSPEIGGISSIVLLPGSSRLLALSDARRDCRFFTFDIEWEEDRWEFIPREVNYLRHRDGIPFSPGTLDPEGLARLPGGELLVSSEGDIGEVPEIEPGIFLFGSDGVLIREIPVPEKFLPGVDGELIRGARRNLAFEGLALSPDQRRLFVATEGALLQDDDATSPERGARTRILEYALAGDQISPIREYAYDLDPVATPDDFGPGEGENGLVEILVLNDGELLALERSYFAEGTGDGRSHQQIRLYRAFLGGASDVSGYESLRDVSGIVPVRKELLLDLEDILDKLSPASLDNFEGMCFGPRLKDGRRTLILVSDNNFKDRQRTAFLVFGLTEPGRGGGETPGQLKSS